MHPAHNLTLFPYTTLFRSELSLIIHPAKNILGAIRLPGDKSISHRYAMLAALAQSATRLTNFSTGADCASTDRKSTRLNSSHLGISYAVFCLKTKKIILHL